MANEPDGMAQEQVAAARLRLVLDKKLGRDSPDLVRRIARLSAGTTAQRPTTASTSTPDPPPGGHDRVTGLVTATDFATAATSRLRATPDRNSTSWLLLIDVDWFKMVNDKAGHLVGDSILRQIGALISDQIGDNDLLGRFGGDEFIVLITRWRDNPNTGREIAEHMRTAVAGYGWSSMVGSTTRLGISIGVATAHPGEELDSLLARADELVYRAKELGRDRVVVDQPEINTGT